MAGWTDVSWTTKEVQPQTNPGLPGNLQVFPKWVHTYIGYMGKCRFHLHFKVVFVVNEGRFTIPSLYGIVERRYGHTFFQRVIFGFYSSNCGNKIVGCVSGW